MNKKLADFIVELAVDSDRARRFREDPSGELAAAGLSSAEQAAILSRNSDRVRSALGNSFADHLTQFSAGGRPSKPYKKPSKKKAATKTGKAKKSAGKKR